MQRAKAFFFVCAGLFLLALAYHFGVSSAMAQAGSPTVGVAYSDNMYGLVVVTEDGDVYTRGFDTSGGFHQPTPVFRGNYWGGATPAQRESWGGVKSRYLSPDASGQDSRPRR